MSTDKPVNCRPNRGHFQKGYDPRRHILSKAEARKGFQMFLLACRNKKIPSRVAAHVRRKLRERKIALENPEGIE